MNLLTMFDSTDALAAHRASTAGRRYTLPDYPVREAVPIRAEGHLRREPESWPEPQKRYAPRVPLSPALAECMAAAARLPGPFAVDELAVELLGTASRAACCRVWTLLNRLLLAELVRRAGSEPRAGTRPASLFEIVPDEEAREA